MSDPIAWRKHDWPDRNILEAQPLGHQASDALANPRFGFPLIVQTFDFGDGGRAFGTLDRGRGDGGDAATIVDGAAWIFFTEDGGAGQQWFVGEACRTDKRPEAARASWLIFANDVTRNRWRDRVARLNRGVGPDACPARFSDAYTRYTRDTLIVPFRFVKPNSDLAHSMRPVDTVISEHFGGSTIPAAKHLERFYLGRGLGKYRWERWENAALSKTADARRAAKTLRTSGRCPAITYSDPPGPDWLMVDCRTWTNLVRLTEPWSAAELNWPGHVFDVLKVQSGVPGQ
ncbi:hypothetical protein JNW90_12005 [Micromonospora sp. STR1s_5]|nr:hypothetical protein [Micromonospora sp. STR1s_5]